MSDTLELHGTTYTIPTTGDTGWGDNLNTFLQALCEAVSGLITFGASAGAGGATKYAVPGNGAAGATEIKMRMPMACTLTNLYARSTAVPTTGSVVCTVRLNGADTSLAVTLTTSDTAASRVDGVSVAAGDDISVKLVQSSGGGCDNLVLTIGVQASTGS